MKKFWLVWGMVMVVGWTTPSFAATTQVDALIKKLVDKGILTQSEAEELKTEVAKDEETAHATNVKKDVPEWVQNLKLSGDFRLRQQFEQRKPSETRNRARIRFRLGIDTKVNDTVKIGAGLATGSSDARSTNQTLDTTFAHKGLMLDYAYAQWTPDKSVSMIGGKFKRDDWLWQPSDLLWDDDIRPEGGSINLSKEFMDGLQGYVKSGVWILDESAADTSDPYMFYAQPGLVYKNENMDGQLAVAYYGFSHLRSKAAPLTGTAGTNSTDASGKYLYKYDSVNPGLEIGFTEPFDLPIERIAVFGEYIDNFDPSKQNTGWLAGLKFGAKKIAKRGQWQFKYLYASLGKDAFIDSFPDSDRYGGKTDIKGHEWILEYGLSKNVTVAFDYYHSDRLKAASAPESLLQSDLNFKF